MLNKLYQCFFLDEESKVQSFLVPNSTVFESAFGPLEFDFHPYKVLALFDKKYELKELPSDLILSFFKACDDLERLLHILKSLA